MEAYRGAACGRKVRRWLHAVREQRTTQLRSGRTDGRATGSHLRRLQRRSDGGRPLPSARGVKQRPPSLTTITVGVARVACLGRCHELRFERASEYYGLTFDIRVKRQAPAQLGTHLSHAVLVHRRCAVLIQRSGSRLGGSRSDVPPRINSMPSLSLRRAATISPTCESLAQCDRRSPIVTLLEPAECATLAPAVRERRHSVFPRMRSVTVCAFHALLPPTRWMLKGTPPRVTCPRGNRANHAAGRSGCGRWRTSSTGIRLASLIRDLAP
jgi:hypothetical protein